MPALGLSLALPRSSRFLVINGGFISPTNVTLAHSGTANNRTLTVDWDAPVGDSPDSYLIEISFNGGDFGDPQAVSHPTTVYAYTGQFDGIYIARVRSVYAAGTSSFTLSPTVNTGAWFVIHNAAGAA